MQDSLFDLTWSEAHENQVLVASGDGSVKLFDVALDQFPVSSWQEHNREVFAVHWNLVSKDSFCSSSWDGTVKVVRVSCLTCCGANANDYSEVVSRSLHLPSDFTDP